MIRVDDLREEQAEGDDRRIDGVVVADLLGLEGLVDDLGFEQLVEREQVGLAEGFHFRREGHGGSLVHRRPPWGRAWMLFPTILVPREAGVCLSPFTLSGYAQSVCHSYQVQGSRPEASSLNSGFNNLKRNQW